MLFVMLARRPGGDPFVRTGKPTSTIAPGSIQRGSSIPGAAGIVAPEPSWDPFISEDPIGLEGGINFYSYARDNPVRFSDPSGNNPLAFGGAIVGGILNYYNNVDAYIAGTITPQQFLGSIAIGAGSGAIGGILLGAYGVIGGALAGGVGDLYQQTLTPGKCLKVPDRAVTLGLLGGTAAAYLQFAGEQLVTSPSTQVGTLSRHMTFRTHGNLAGLVAGTIASLLSN